MALNWHRETLRQRMARQGSQQWDDPSDLDRVADRWLAEHENKTRTKRQKRPKRTKCPPKSSPHLRHGEEPATHEWPIEIYRGRESLGWVVDLPERGSFKKTSRNRIKRAEAFDADGQSLGRFEDREGAINAVFAAERGGSST